MKYSSSIILILALGSLTLTQNADFSGCVLENKGRCYSCYRRKVDEVNGGCLKKQPASDHCDLYTFLGKAYGKSCSACKPGYVAQVVKGAKPPKTVCRPSQTKNCLFENASSNPNGKPSCIACKEGLYAVVDDNYAFKGCERIPNPIPNCLWGGIASASQIECARCKPGYATGGKKGCVKAPQKGCWTAYASGGTIKCRTCDPFQGYSINAQGKCFK